MAMTYREWLKVNPEGSGFRYQEYLTGVSEAARQANVTAVVETTGIWSRVLGHYSIEGGTHLYCLRDSVLVDFVSDGDTLLTLAVKAFAHEKKNHQEEYAHDLFHTVDQLLRRRRVVRAARDHRRRQGGGSG